MSDSASGKQAAQTKMKERSICSLYDVGWAASIPKYSSQPPPPPPYTLMKILQCYYNYTIPTKSFQSSLDTRRWCDNDLTSCVQCTMSSRLAQRIRSHIWRQLSCDNQATIWRLESREKISRQL